MIVGAEKQREMIKNDPTLAKYLKKHNVRGSVIEQPHDSSESRRSLNVSTLSSKTQVYTSTDKTHQLGPMKEYQPPSAKKLTSSNKKVVNK
jgi:hypothetical protein